MRDPLSSPTPPRKVMPVIMRRGRVVQGALRARNTPGFRVGHGRAAGRSASGVHVGLFAVHADVETAALVVAVARSGITSADQLQQHEAHDAAVDDGRADRDGLNHQLPGIAEEQPVGDAVQGLLARTRRSAARRPCRRRRAPRRRRASRRATSSRARSARSSWAPPRSRRGESRSSG